MTMIWGAVSGFACWQQPAELSQPVAAAAVTVAVPKGAASAWQQLYRLDLRAPVPLLPRMAAHQKQNMREHLQAVQGAIASLALGDFAGVSAAVAPIGFSQSMGQMCEHMGAGAPGFAEQAIEFHHAADRVAEAAERQDASAVLSELSNTLQTCTSCHAAWKQQVVDAAHWAALDNAPHEVAPMVGH